MTDLKLIVTIDTEEDDWSDYSRVPASVSNLDKIPELQQVFDDASVKPTYLVSFPVAVNDAACSIFREILGKGRCEIGAHCHPWNTPPFEEAINKVNSMLCNLPQELQYRKLQSLRDAIRNALGIDAMGFRAGRWGFDGRVASNIVLLGFRVDTSVSPFMNWSMDHGPDYSEMGPSPYWFPVTDSGGNIRNGSLLEVPATVAFLQKDFMRANRIHRFLRRRSFRPTRIIGILDRLKLLNKYWLSPEFSTADEMISLTKVLMSRGYRFVNMTFHSPSLKAGLSPFVATKEEEEQFLDRIREYLAFVRDTGIESIELSRALEYFEASSTCP